MILVLILSITVLLVCSAMTSATETAITATTVNDIADDVHAGKPQALRLHRLLTNKETTISSLLLANNIFNILGAALATDMFLKLVGEAGVVLATAVMTVLVVIFAEVLPKSYAIRNTRSFAMMMSLPTAILVTTARPISYVLGLIVIMVMKLLKIDHHSYAGLSPADQLRGMLSAFKGQAGMMARTRQMLRGVLDLAQISLDAVITHRSRVFSLDATQRVADCRDRLVNAPYSRIPLFEGERDHIVGVLQVRDLFAAKDEQLLSEIMQQPWFVPETTSLQKQLDAFVARRTHLALVVDEYGDWQGIVTLEDIIEMVVGNIEDERDHLSDYLEQKADGSFEVTGDTSVRQVMRLCERDLPLDKAASLAGLIIEELGRIPVEGEVVRLYDLSVEIVERRGHRLTRLNLKMEDQNIPEA